VYHESTAWERNVQKLVYTRGPATLANVRKQIDSIWRQLPQDADFEQLCREYPELRELELKSPVPFIVVANSAGLTSELGDIAVQIVRGVVLVVTTDAILALWKKVILKKVRERLGKDVLKDKNESAGGSDS
jgi:hypothetical protein